MRTFNNLATVLPLLVANSNLRRILTKKSNNNNKETADVTLVNLGQVEGNVVNSIKIKSHTDAQHETN